MRYLISCFIILQALNLSAQKSVTIAGEAYVYNGQILNVGVTGATKKPVGNEFVRLASIPLDSQYKFNYKLTINKPRWLIVRYGQTMNPVYVYPGDSLHIHFTLADKMDTTHSMMMTRGTREHWDYSGSDSARMAFIQTLQKETGQLADGPPFVMDTKQPGFFENYKAKVKGVYQKRIDMLNAYAAKYNFKGDFKMVVANEIRATYLSDMMYPGFYGELLDKFPPEYSDEIDNENITWDEFKDSKAWESAMYMNVMYYHRKVAKQPEDEKLANVFENTIRIKDDSVRNFMMTLIMSKNVDQHPANFDELFARYKQLCTNPDYVKGLSEIYNPSFVEKVLPSFVLDASLKSDADLQVKLRDIVPAGKPVLIDFWASWCGPCIKEVPELMKLAEKYKGKIDFRFISVDVKEKEGAWLKAIKDKNFKGAHYIIQDKVLSEFAELKSIPRYLVLDKNGKLNTFRGPNLLEDPKGFEDRIKAVVEDQN